MNMRFRWAVPCFLVTVAITAFAALRPPTPAEQAAIEKYAKVVDQVLDQFRSDDWDENIEYTFDDVSVSTTDPAVPLDIDRMAQRTYHVRKDSSRWNDKIAGSFSQLMGTGDMQAKQKIGAQIQSLMHVQVQVHSNRAAVGFEPPPSSNHDLHIPGAAFAYKIHDEAFGGHGSAYVLVFGNWSNAKWDATNGWYSFHFAHPQNTPYIENIEVRIYGADDRIQELLHSIDWNAMNGALTR